MRMQVVASTWLTVGLLVVAPEISVSAVSPASPIDTVHLRERREGRPRGVFPVESFQRLPVDSLNAQIAAAATRGESWTQDAVLIALRLTEHGPDALDERRVLEIRFEGEGRRGDRPDSAIVTLVEDDFMDDSVRGSWTRLSLVRAAPRRDVMRDPAPWRLVEFRVAWICQRGHHQNSFSAQPCL
jgi:hypothetical protein